jgi:lambda family phage minor tail protein L
VTIQEDLRGFEVDTDIIMHTLDLTPMGGSVYYFSNTVNEDGSAISFGGQVYTHLPCQMTGMEISGDGKPTQPTFTVATLGGPVAALILQYNDLRGAVVTRTHTLGKYLDFLPDGTTANGAADGTAKMPTSLFIISQKVSANRTGAEFQLVSPIDTEGARLPLTVVKKRYCDQIYRRNDGGGSFTYTGRGNPCPWAGSDGTPGGTEGPYFDENNKSSTADNDRCSKTVQGCLVRFGDAVDLPFGGFIGVKAFTEQ